MLCTFCRVFFSQWLVQLFPSRAQSSMMCVFLMARTLWFCLQSKKKKSSCWRHSLACQRSSGTILFRLESWFWILVTSVVPRVWRGRSYDVWRFQLVAYLTTVDPHVADVANDVARTTAPHVVADLPTDDEGKTSYLMLYSTIVCCMNNRPPRPIMETVSSDGRETLHKLDAAYRPTYRGTQMALLQQIIHPPLNSANSDAECMGNLSDWHKIVPASPVCVPRKSSQTTIHGRCELQTTEEVVENTRAS